MSVTDAWEELARLGHELNKSPGLEEWKGAGTSTEPSITPLPLTNCFKMG